MTFRRALPVYAAVYAAAGRTPADAGNTSGTLVAPEDSADESEEVIGTAR